MDLPSEEEIQAAARRALNKNRNQAQQAEFEDLDNNIDTGSNQSSSVEEIPVDSYDYDNDLDSLYSEGKSASSEVSDSDSMFSGNNFNDEDIQPKIIQPDTNDLNDDMRTWSGEERRTAGNKSDRRQDKTDAIHSEDFDYFGEDDEEDVRRKKDAPKKGTKAYANEIQWQHHPAWTGMIGWYFKAFGIAAGTGVLMYLLGFQFKVIHPVLFFLGTVIAFVVVFLLGKLIRKATVYTITRTQVSERKGIFNTRSEQARLDRITNIKITRNMYERLFKLGKVDIDTANDSENILDWWGVKDPYKVEELINDLRDDMRDGYDDGT